MIERRQMAILTGPSVGTLTCFGWLLFCPHRADCINALTRFDIWVSAGTTIVLPLAAASMAVWLAQCRRQGLIRMDSEAAEHTRRSGARSDPETHDPRSTQREVEWRSHTSGQGNLN